MVTEIMETTRNQKIQTQRIQTTEMEIIMGITRTQTTAMVMERLQKTQTMVTETTETTRSQKTQTMVTETTRTQTETTLRLQTTTKMFRTG